MKNRPEDNKYFHYYNANPKSKETRDCTYRALSLFLGKSWEEIAKLDAEFYLEHGMWLYGSEVVGDLCRMPKSPIDFFMSEHGYMQIYQYNSGEHIPTIREFIDKHTEDDDVYLCQIQGHMVAIKDNCVWDTKDSSECCPVMIFVRSNEKQPGE